jgi:hypothetical protein
MTKQEELFQIGDIVWYSETHRTAKHVPCPVCFGKKEVTVILGNGEQIITPCRYCEIGFEGPRGWVEGDYEWTADAGIGKITSMRSEMSENGELDVVYYFSGNGRHHTRCANTREEAIAKALVECQEWQAKEDAQKAEYVKKYGYRDYSYNAGYHRREAERAYKSYLWHLDHAHHFEEKARPRDAKDKHK